MSIQGRQPSPGRDRRTSGYLPSIAEESDVDIDDDRDYLFAGDSPYRSNIHPSPSVVIAFTVFIGWSVIFAILYPFPTTIHIFVAFLVGCVCWTGSEWAWIVERWRNSKGGLRRSLQKMKPRRRTVFLCSNVGLVSCTLFGLRVPVGRVPALEEHSIDTDRWFIAANLYNNERVLPRWSEELLKLVTYLGHDRVFISIYESNSRDSTPNLLTTFAHRLQTLSISHRILTGSSTPRDWPYGTSPERIQFLADARNTALEPLQSGDESVRLKDWQTYTKVIFLNDVYYDWRAIARLLSTKLPVKRRPEGTRADERARGVDYDLVCGIDFGSSGLYDTWVARDVCGNPMRIAWPYVKDPVSTRQLARQEPFEVAACWNGVVAFPSAPYLYVEPAAKARPDVERGKRGWKMVDNATYPNDRLSPPLTSPLKFRTSEIDACDHSECFLFSYDLHRLYSSNRTGGSTGPRRPRIYMNPTVKVAYEWNWWKWNNVVLEIPILKLWNRYWSRGFPLVFVDWIWEYFTRRRDYCTWAGFALPKRCPALEGAVERPWNA